MKVRAVAVLVPEALPEDRAPVRAAIARWRDRGVETVLACTGGIESAAPLAEALGHVGPMILDLGASIRTGADRRLARTMPIPERVVADLERQLASVGESVSRRVGEVDAGTRKVAVRIDLAGDAEQLDAGLAAIASPHWQSGAIAVFRLGPERATIVAGGVDKSAGLQRVLRGFGLPPSRVVVAAAAEEDLGLVDWCRAIVVGTPSDRLRAAAARVADRGDWRAVEAFVASALPGLEGLDA
jgi:hydroxymethylpyrimidine pyrophosphatase-like HAD family hydrolase